MIVRFVITHLKYWQENELCLVLEYNWNYPRSEVTKTAPSPGLVTLTQVTVTRVYPRMQPSIAPHFTAKRVWDNLQIFPLH